MKKYLTFDIGGSKVLAGIVGEDGKIFKICRKDYPVPYSKEQLSGDLKNMARSLPLEDVAAGGMTIPGIADGEKGIWRNASFSKISDWNIADEFSAEFGIPFYAENDVNICAVGEHMFGLCQNEDSFMWITLSNGVGGAFFLDGKLYSGKNLGAGEIGHVTVEENGKRCACGNRGCLETAASGRGIRDYYQSLTGQKISARKIAECAKNGEKAALKTYERTGRALGKAISYAANLLNIDTFILGGGVARDMELFIDMTYLELDKRLFKSANPSVSIKYTGLGYNAGLIGSAAYATERGEKE